jgi:hypothetical protein
MKRQETSESEIGIYISDHFNLREGERERNSPMNGCMQIF